MSARDAILRHTEAAGSDEELEAFYEKHEGRFRWNRDQRKFIVESPWRPTPPRLLRRSS